MGLMIGIAGYGGQGKSTLAKRWHRILKDTGIRSVVMSFATPVYKGVVADTGVPMRIFRSPITKDSKVALIKLGIRLHKKYDGCETPRDLLIRYAETEREKDPSVWITKMFARIPDDAQVVIVDDMRKQIEAMEMDITIWFGVAYTRKKFDNVSLRPDMCDYHLDRHDDPAISLYHVLGIKPTEEYGTIKHFGPAMAIGKLV